MVKYYGLTSSVDLMRYKFADIPNLVSRSIINARTEPAATPRSTGDRRSLSLNRTAVFCFILFRDNVHQMYFIGIDVYRLEILISTNDPFCGVCPSSVQRLFNNKWTLGYGKSNVSDNDNAMILV